MAAPANDDDVGTKSLGFAEDSIDRRLVDNNDLRIRPSPRKGSSHAGGNAGRTAALPRNHRLYAGLDRPWKRYDCRESCMGLRRAVSCD
jgi:hypothetical protein